MNDSEDLRPQWADELPRLLPLRARVYVYRELHGGLTTSLTPLSTVGHRWYLGSVYTGAAGEPLRWEIPRPLYVWSH